MRSLVYRLFSSNPARTLGALAGVATAIAALLDQAGVQTWQAALPVLLAEGIRRFVYCPTTVERLLEQQVATIRRRVLDQP